MTDKLGRLERLARLKEQGAISAAEYEAEKSTVLANGPSEGSGPRAAGLGRAVMSTTAAAILAVSGYFLYSHYAHPAVPNGAPAAERRTVDTPPRCDSAEARALIKDMFENGPQSKVLHLRVLDVTGIAERSYDRKKRERVCASDVELNTGVEHIGYSLGFNSTGDYILRAVADPGPSISTADPTRARTTDAMPEDETSMAATSHRVNPNDQSRAALAALDPEVAALINRHGELYESCRGGVGDDPQTHVTCQMAEAVSDTLEEAGMCFISGSASWVTCGDE